MQNLEAGLEAIVEEVRNELEAKNSARDAALQRSRQLIRNCANAIRAASGVALVASGVGSTAVILRIVDRRAGFLTGVK